MLPAPSITCVMPTLTTERTSCPFSRPVMSSRKSPFVSVSSPAGTAPRSAARSSRVPTRRWRSVYRRLPSSIRHRPSDGFSGAQPSHSVTLDYFWRPCCSSSQYVASPSELVPRLRCVSSQGRPPRRSTARCDHFPYDGGDLPSVVWLRDKPRFSRKLIFRDLGPARGRDDLDRRPAVANDRCKPQSIH